MGKLSKLAEFEGMTVMELLKSAAMNSVSPGICVNKGCYCTTQVDSKCRDGYCEKCGTRSIKSALALAGLI